MPSTRRWPKPTTTSPIRRGIAPGPLLDLVRNTAPFLFSGGEPSSPALSYLRLLRAWDGGEPDHLGYFRFCLAAHWATAGTYVPTDVDNAIRQKLWQMEEARDALEAMADVVLEALRWDYRPVTARIAACARERVSTHEGTWFSVAAGAYAALKQAGSARASGVLEAVMAEARREAALFAALCRAGPSLELLKACALLAHNFGDLDRVIDAWELPDDDALRRGVYDAAAPTSLRFGGLLAYAGALNQRNLAPENHRHFALRAPRGLRAKAELLVPVGPFFDDWGRQVAGEPAELCAEAVRALIDGWQRLPRTYGYPRALAGILEAFPGGMARLEGLIPSRDARLLRSGELRRLTSVPRGRFEAQWRNLARLTPPPAAALPTAGLA